MTVVPTATTRPPRALAAFTASAVTAGTRKRSACGASPASCEERPVCRVIGRDAHALADQPRHEVGGEGSRRGRHLGAARVDAEDGLVVRQRVAAVEVPVGDRPSGPGHGGGQVAGRGRPPEAVADARGGRVLPRVRRGEGERGAVEHDGLARDGVEDPSRRIGRGAELDDVRAVVEAGGDVHDDVAVRRARGVGLRRDRGAGVHDDEVARGQLVGEVAEHAMSEVTRGACHEEADAVPRDAAVLGGCCGEGHQGHAETPVRVATSAAT